MRRANRCIKLNRTVTVHRERISGRDRIKLALKIYATDVYTLNANKIELTFPKCCKYI